MPEKIADAVQPDAWYEALPRPQYATLEAVEQPDPWFSVYRLPHDVYAIYEPGHFQEVISYLVLGGEKALLIDTGMGMGNIKKMVDFLTDKPLVVVNTHSHFDHIGCNWMFEKVHIYNHPGAIRRMKEGLTHQEVEDNLKPCSNWIPYPADFVPEEYAIKPCNYVPIENGHQFDLGGRVLTAFITPGHSPDSIMLADDANKLLFTGDTFYPATLYAHLDSHDGLKSVIDTYKKTMEEVAAKYGDYTLICSHNEPMREGKTLGQVADAFAAIETGDLPYQEDENHLKKYTFDGFCIVTL